LKLVVAGYRANSTGKAFSDNNVGYYWSSTVNGSNARDLGFSSVGALMYSHYRAMGISVRCIKK
jgi:hypothetical protein